MSCAPIHKRGHGKSAPTRIRHDCPAYGTICDKCGQQNHFASVCRSKGKPTKPKQPTPPCGTSKETESAIFDSLCTATSLRDKSGKGIIALDHHLYCHLTDHWVRQPSKPQPFITLMATAHPEDYTALRFNTPKSRLTPVQLSAMAGTGCQSCLASIKVIRRLGLSESDLIPVTMQMHAVNNNGIKILGAAILRFSGKSPSSKTLEIRQIVYVTSDPDKLFLNGETCTALGMITKNFPTMGETLHTRSSTKPDAA